MELFVGMLLACCFVLILYALSGSEMSHEHYVSLAHEIAGTNPALLKRLNALPAELAPQTEKDEFLSSLRNAAADEKMTEQITTICRQSGVEKPTGTDLLIARQIAEAQTQNSLLRRLEKLSDK